MTDAYQTLGVHRNATEADIKKAYRAMASKHHPDKGGDTAKFQEIQSAYETLTDPQKRHQHDNPNPFGHAQNGPNNFEFHFGAGGGPEDIFSQFFRQQGFNGHDPLHRQVRRNKDLRVQLSIELKDTLADQKRTISVQTTKGDRFNIDVNIPRGVSNGTTIKYGGMGDNMFDSLTRGDLYVIINVIHDQRFDISGNNLIANIEIDAIDAMLGAERAIHGIDGREFLVKIPQACQYNAKFALSGQGLYHMNTNVRGDLIVAIQIKIPTLNSDQLNILKTIKPSL
jgi:curved DNA-binding protein